MTESSKRYFYLYETEAVAPGGRPDIWLRGRVLGGSSATNGMIYNRGRRDDWDALPGWGWDDIPPIFREVEDHKLGATGLRGAPSVPARWAPGRRRSSTRSCGCAASTPCG